MRRTLTKIPTTITSNATKQTLLSFSSSGNGGRRGRGRGSDTPYYPFTPEPFSFPLGHGRGTHRSPPIQKPFVAPSNASSSSPSRGHGRGGPPISPGRVGPIGLPDDDSFPNPRSQNQNLQVAGRGKPIVQSSAITEKPTLENRPTRSRSRSVLKKKPIIVPEKNEPVEDPNSLYSIRQSLLNQRRINEQVEDHSLDSVIKSAKKRRHACVLAGRPCAADIIGSVKEELHELSFGSCTVDGKDPRF